MPHAYESMRDKFQAEGLSKEEAEGKAARIFNANRPKGATPMGKNYEARAAKRRVGIRKGQ